MRLPDPIDCLFEHPSPGAAQVLLPMVYNIGSSEFPASKNMKIPSGRNLGIADMQKSEMTAKHWSLAEELDIAENRLIKIINIPLGGKPHAAAVQKESTLHCKI